MKNILILIIIASNIFFLIAKEQEDIANHSYLNNRISNQSFKNFEDLADNFLIVISSNGSIKGVNYKYGTINRYKSLDDFSNNCLFFVQAIKIEKNKSNLKEINLSENINIYPLPANDKIIIESTTCKIKSYKIFDINGCCVMNSKNLSNKELFELDVNDMVNGAYQIVIFTSNNTIINKIFFVKR